MERLAFDGGIGQIQLVTNRKLNLGQKDFIFRKLEHIPNDLFKKILDTYLDEVPCPTNIIGFFRNTYVNTKPVKPFFTDDGKSGWANGEYAQEDQILFSKCVGLAMTAKKRKLIIFDDWRKIFDANWLKREGGDLTKWLRAHYRGLQESLGET